VRDSVKRLERRGDALRAVGVREVRHQRNFIDLRQRVQARPGGAVALGGKPEPVHARVHLEEHAVRQLRLVGGQHVDLLVAMNGVPQAQARTQLEVARIKTALQQQDGPAPVQRAQALGLGQVQQGKAVSAAQGIKDALNAMAVGIGLDDRPDLGVRRGGAGAGQVVSERFGVDGGEYGTWHGAMSG
jgi:hypothetical protein